MAPSEPDSGAVPETTKLRILRMTSCCSQSAISQRQDRDTGHLEQRLMLLEPPSSLTRVSMTSNAPSAHNFVTQDRRASSLPVASGRFVMYPQVWALVDVLQRPRVEPSRRATD